MLVSRRLVMNNAKVAQEPSSLQPKTIRKDRKKIRKMVKELYHNMLRCAAR